MSVANNSLARSVLILFLAALAPPPCAAWGPEGHRIVADVARLHLSPSARAQVRNLLGNDDLAAIANWADEIKSAHPETAGWHFVDIPRDATGFSESRDCYSPQHASADHNNCVVDRIEMFQRVLADKTAPREQRIEALKFLVHFVGDIHQPLHAIGQARGGNEIHVIEFGSPQCGSRPCNLHFAWDIGLIEHSGLGESEYAARLEEMISRKHLAGKKDEAPDAWANESFQLAKKVWLSNDGDVDEVYYRTNIRVVDDQLALAGLRLSVLLNQALAQA